MKKIILCLVVMLTVLCGVARADGRLPLEPWMLKEGARQTVRKIIANPPSNDEEKIYACLVITGALNDCTGNGRRPAEQIAPDLVKLSVQYGCESLLKSYQNQDEDPFAPSKLPRAAREWGCRYLLSGWMHPYREESEYKRLGCPKFVNEEIKKYRDFVNKVNANPPANEKDQICVCRGVKSLLKNQHDKWLKVSYRKKATKDGGETQWHSAVRVETGFPHNTGVLDLALPGEYDCDALLNSPLNNSSLVCLRCKGHHLYEMIGLGLFVFFICGLAVWLLLRARKQNPSGK